jgi:hypothetical protein
VRERIASEGVDGHSDAVHDKFRPSDDWPRWGIGSVSVAVMKSKLGSSNGITSSRGEGGDGSIKRAKLMSSPLASRTSQQVVTKRALE